jgi:nucleotide-binding universal stress UspA family protein
VTPALFLAGFSLRSASVQRVFAILELLRAVAAFMIAPVLLHFAVTVTGTPTRAMSTALWVCFGLAAGGALAAAGLYLLGRVRPSAPSLQRWMGGQEPAWDSPPLLAAVRPIPSERAVARTLPGARAAREGGGWLAASLAGGGRLAASLAGSGRLASSLAGRPRREAGDADRAGPVLFAYDGSDLAKAAIAEAGRQLPVDRDALVLTVWRTFNVGFLPEPGTEFDAACGGEVREAAEQTAARGASLAGEAGFRAQGHAVEGTPTWSAIVDAADDHDAGLIVLGSRGRTGIGGRVAGSVAGAVASHSHRPVMIVHDHAGAPAPSESARGRAQVAD